MRPRWQRTTRRETQSVDVTAFLSLMVILVPFLLVTAVFSRTTIIELQAQGQAESEVVGQDPLQLQVVVREEVVEVIYLDLPEPMIYLRSNGARALDSLAALAVELKQKHPDSAEATVLVEPQVSYEFVVQVLDALRVAVERADTGMQRKPLFPAIALGAAPPTVAGGGAGS